MAEVDVAALRRLWDECVRLVDGAAVEAKRIQQADYYRAQTALFEEFIRQAPGVLAALERAERVEQALREADLTLLLEQDYNAIHIALEGRDG